MKLSEFRADYYTHSGKASEAAKRLSFAGIAIIWLLRVDSLACPIEKGLLPPLILFGFSLLTDLLQYTYATFIWGRFHEREEKKVGDPAKEDPMVTAPRWYNRPIWVCFWGKIAAVVVGYVLLLSFLFGKWMA